MCSIPEQGQLAIVRQRRYVSTDVRRSLLPPQFPASPRVQHLVRLSSIEDDALGEELQVVWGIEPGARVFEKMELPEPKGFDRLPTWRRFSTPSDGVRPPSPTHASFNLRSAAALTSKATSSTLSSGQFRCRASIC